MTPVVDGAKSPDWPIWGHAHAIRELQAALAHGPRHAYILAGFKHLGKRTLSLFFAKALLCERMPAAGLPCGECRTCSRIDRGSHPDVAEWNLERQRRSNDASATSRNLTLNIQTVREISSSLAMRPMESQYRLVIVDDVETMQETAQEAFLKTLEEPPSYAIIMLLTSDADALMETIRSRATTVQLQPVTQQTIADGLQSIGLDETTAQEFAALSEGRPGWAILASEDERLLLDRRQRIEEARSWIETDRYNQLIKATALGESFSKDRNSVYVRLAALQQQWRVDLESALEMADSNQILTSINALKSIETCFSDLDANVRPKLALQTMVLQWQSSLQ